MKVADAVLSHPRVYRAAAETGGAILRVLPHFDRMLGWVPANPSQFATMNATPSLSDNPASFPWLFIIFLAIRRGK